MIQRVDSIGKSMAEQGNNLDQVAEEGNNLDQGDVDVLDCWVNSPSKDKLEGGSKPDTCEGVEEKVISYKRKMEKNVTTIQHVKEYIQAFCDMLDQAYTDAAAEA